MTRVHNAEEICYLNSTEHCIIVHMVTLSLRRHLFNVSGRILKCQHRFVSRHGAVFRTAALLSLQHIKLQVVLFFLSY